MTEQQSSSEQPMPPKPQPQAEGQPAQARPQPAQAPPLPTLKCPFCGGKRFDYGRDIYAGAEQAMYCRETPPRGERPDSDLSLPMKGAVCLNCGYVAMMLDLAQLHAPIRRSMDVAEVLARRAGAAAHLAKPVEEEAAEALKRMTSAPGAREVPEPAEPQPAADRGEPPPGGDEGIGDLAELIDEAERSLGLDRGRRGAKPKR